MRPALLAVAALLLAPGCAHDPAPKAEPSPAPAEAKPAPPTAPPRLVRGAGLPLCGEAPPACAGEAATTPVAELLKRTTGGPVVVVGTLVTGDGSCTRSVPPSCYRPLFVEHRQGGPHAKPRAFRIRLGGAHGCSEPAEGRACCTLPVGAAVRVEGEHQVTTGRWGAQHALDAKAVCVTR